MKLLPLAALVAAAMLSALIALDIVWNANNPDQIGPWLDAEDVSLSGADRRHRSTSRCTRSSPRPSSNRVVRSMAGARS